MGHPRRPAGARRLRLRPPPPQPVRASGGGRGGGDHGPAGGFHGQPAEPDVVPGLSLRARLDAVRAGRGHPPAGPARPPGPDLLPRHRRRRPRHRPGRGGICPRSRGRRVAVATAGTPASRRRGAGGHRRPRPPRLSGGRQDPHPPSPLRSPLVLR